MTARRLGTIIEEMLIDMDEAKAVIAGILPEPGEKGWLRYWTLDPGNDHDFIPRPFVVQTREFDKLRTELKTKGN